MHNRKVFMMILFFSCILLVLTEKVLIGQTIDLTSLGGTASASSTYSPPMSPVFSADLAFDDDVYTLWRANSSQVPQWIQWDFGAGVNRVVSGYTIQIVPTPINGASILFTMVSWVFQGSNNGSDWSPLDSQSGVTFNHDEKKSFSISNSTSYRYYRFADMTMIQGPGGYDAIAAKPTSGEMGESSDVNPTATEIELLGLTGPPPNNAPVVSDIPDQTTNEDTPTPPIPFTVTDTDGGGLSFIPTSDNTGLLPHGNVVIETSGAGYTVIFTPLPDRWGTANVDFVVSDGFNYVHQYVGVHVLPIDDPPVITLPTPSVTYTEDDPLVTLPDALVDDPDNWGPTRPTGLMDASVTPFNNSQTFTVTVSSDNPATGTLTTTSGNGETYDDITGDWTVTGDQSQVNDALAELSFIPALNNDVSSILTYIAVDGTGLSSDPVTLSLQAIGVYDPPQWNQDVGDQTLRHDEIFSSEIFADGFESGDLSAWSTTIPDGKVNVGLSRHGGSTYLGKMMLTTTTVGWTLTITPVPGQFGTTEVILTVSDGVGEDNDTLNVTVLPKPRYTLTTLVAGGTGGTVTPETTEYDSCTWVTITAVPDEKYSFQEWSGDLTGSTNPDSVHMNEDKTVTAHFLQDLDPPELVNQYPAPGSIGLPLTTNLQFTVQDGETGVDLSSLNVTVDGILILSNGTDQTGGRVIINSYSPRYTVIYDPAVDFESESTVTVAVACADLVIPGNTLNTSYEFNISDSATVTMLASAWVGPHGGNVTHDTSGLQITIPAGAMEDSVEITIGLTENPPVLPDSLDGIALPLHFGPDGFQFSDSVIIRIPYNQALLDSAGVTDPMDLKLYYFLTTTGEWIELKVVDADAEFFYIKVMQFCYLTAATVPEGTRVVYDPFKRDIPTRFELFQNHPNPFNPLTTIHFALPERTHVNLSIYNMKGQRIQILLEEFRDMGFHTVEWNASAVGTGIYFFVIRAGAFAQVRKCILMK